MVALPRSWRAAGIAAMPAFALIAYSHDAVLCRLAPAEPALVAAGRFAVAAVLLWPLVVLRERPCLRRLGSRELLLTLLAGILLAADFAAWIAATQRTSVANSLLLTHLAPLWILLLTLLWLRRRPGPIECVVAALSIVGAGIVGEGGLAERAGAHWHGDLLAVASSLPAAGFIMLSAMALTRVPLLVYLALSWSWAGVLLAAAAWLSGAGWPVDRDVLGAIAAMGIVAQLLGHGLLTLSLRWLTPCFVAASCLLEPVLGSLWASLYLGEVVAGATLAGGALVLLAIWIGARGEADRLRPADSPAFRPNQAKASRANSARATNHAEAT